MSRNRCLYLSNTSKGYKRPRKLSRCPCASGNSPEGHYIYPPPKCRSCWSQTAFADREVLSRKGELRHPVPGRNYCKECSTKQAQCSLRKYRLDKWLHRTYPGWPFVPG